MRKKVAIISCFWVKNYGSVLQAFATQYKLSKLGIENETINYDCSLSGIDKLTFRLGCLRLKSMWKAKIDTIKKRLQYRDIVFLENERKRCECFNRFIENNFNTSPKYTKINDISRQCNSFSAFVVGSDQLWLPVNILINYYTLDFVPDNIKKVAYATSFGISKIPSFLKQKYIKFLSRIDYISVRELQGREIVKELTGRDIPVVCDPTLMLTAEDWASVQKEKPIIQEPYIFCYFLGNNEQHRIFAKKVRECTSLKIVSLLHLDHFVKSDEGYADYTPYDIDPGDFINLIKHAQYILTDSFHGSIFSIIHHKNFYVFNRYQANVKSSTNSRIDSLLSITHLEDRRLSGIENPQPYIEKEIDYSIVDIEISKLRQKTDEYLLKALG